MQTISGLVQKGKQRGKALGYPTANIPLADASLSGIYIARTTVENREYPTAVFIDAERKLLEAYLLDFSAELYGQTIEVELLQKIREGERFETEEKLKEAIDRDVQAVRNFFRK